jgi:probable rRNA maturation factor
MTLAILNRQRTRRINARRLRAIVEALLADLGIAAAELGINLVGDREMTLINQTFLRHSGSTDVITFDHGPDTANPPGRAPGLHGELFVCVDEAVAQAKRFRGTWQAEIVRYIVHGVLHLLGHDDRKPERRRRMKRAENRLVRRLGAKNSFAQLARTAKIRP